MFTPSKAVPAAADTLEPLPLPLPLAWPAPHHMRVIDGRAGEAAERALVTLVGGEKLLGTVRAIDFERGTLDFQSERGSQRVLAFRDFRSLFLSRSIELEPVPMAVPPGAIAARPKRARRACIVRLKDGAVLQAEVAAVLPRQSGLFLYVVNYADAVLRWFVPAQAVAHYHVGEQVSGYKGRLGVYEMLVNTPAIKRAIQQRASSAEILTLAVADGMTTLEQDALEKTMQGHLDLKQVLASCR
jgi:hypothetical protein